MKRPSLESQHTIQIGSYASITLTNERRSGSSEVSNVSTAFTATSGEVHMAGGRIAFEGSMEAEGRVV